MKSCDTKPISKEELIEAVEKARPQTRGQALRVIDMLVGVRSDPFAKKDREKRKPQKSVPPKIIAESEGKMDNS